MSTSTKNGVTMVPDDSKLISKDEAGVAAKGFSDLPFDVTFRLWKETFEDETRVVLGAVVMRTGAEVIQHPALERSHPDEFILDIVPSKLHVAEFAATMLQSDLSVPTFLNETLEIAQKDIFESKNIVFIGDIQDAFRPLYDEYEDRAKLSTELAFRPLGMGDLEIRTSVLKLMRQAPEFRLGRCSTIRSLAFYAFPRTFQTAHANCTSLNTMPEDLMLKVISSLKGLQVVYLVLDTRALFNHGVLPKARFVSGAKFMNQDTGAPGIVGDHPAMLNGQRWKAAVMGHYQLASALKSRIQKEIESWNWRVEAEKLYGDDVGDHGPRNLEIKIVQWEM